jgi:hypothetical protein
VARPESASVNLRQDLPESVVLAAGFGLGLLLRAVQIATSVGTVDVTNWLRHLLYVRDLGVLRCYEASKAINHPLLSLEIAQWTWRLGDRVGLTFFDSYRMLTSAADLVTALALLALCRRIQPANAVRASLLFFLSPAAVFISAFHCNSDSLMVMFVVCALLATATERPLLAGLLIACAGGIKIIAFVALPLLPFAFRGWRQRWVYVSAAAVISGAIFLPPVLVSGTASIENIFGYTGWKGAWGFRIVFDVLGRLVPAIAIESSTILTPLLLLCLLVLWAFVAREGVRRSGVSMQRTTTAVALAFLLVLFLGPGFGVQYLMWILPFPALLLRARLALGMQLLISFFLFEIYTNWSGGWPWEWADASKHEQPMWIGLLGLVVWAAIGGCALISARALRQPEREPQGSA